MTIYRQLQETKRIRVSDGLIVPILEDIPVSDRLLVIILPQLGDFDSLEYAWWLKKYPDYLKGITLRAIGIGDRESGRKFCRYTGFDENCLFMDEVGEIHRRLGLYGGLSLKLPLMPALNPWVNLILMCAGIGSPGTLKEVFRGYRGDRSAPQLIDNEETVHAKPLPPLKGEVFKFAGGEGFQRPFELATLRLRNMVEVLGNWSTYVPDPAYITVRGGTFLFDAGGELLYEHRDRGILGFSANMSRPLEFLEAFRD